MLADILKRQVEEKNKRISTAKSMEKIDPQKIYKFVENYDNCYKCHKLYPTKALNITNLNDARNIRKQSNK